MIWRRSAKIVGVFDQKGSRMKLFWEPEQGDVMRGCLGWLRRERGDSVLVSGGLLGITFVLPTF
jgi:hypothetical protein